MKKIILIIILFLFIAAVGFHSYITFYFVPTQLKQIIINKSQEFFDRKVSLDSIEAGLLKGVTVAGLTVYQKEDATLPFIQIHKIRFAIPFPVFSKDQGIIIPSLDISKPNIHLIRKNIKEWNISDLTGKHSGTDEEKTPPLIIRKISIKQGRIKVTDNTTPSVSSHIFDSINANASFSLKGTIEFGLNARIPNTPSIININGNFDITSKKLAAMMSASDINLKRYLNTFYYNANLEIKTGTLKKAELKLELTGKEWSVSGGISALADIVLNKNGKTYNMRGDMFTNNFSLEQKKNTRKMSGDFIINDSSMSLEKTFKLKGKILAQKILLIWEKKGATLKGNMLRIENANIQAHPNLTFEGIIMTKPFLASFKKDNISIKTAIQFNADKITIDEDKKMSGGIVANDLLFKMTGKDIQLTTYIKTKKLDFLFKKDISFHGSPSINLQLSHEIDAKRPVSYRGSVALYNASLDNITVLKSQKDIKNIRGEISFEHDLLKTGILKFHALDNDIEIAGTLKNFKNPFINIRALSEDVSLDILSFLFPEHLEKMQIIPTGQASVGLHYSGLLSSPEKANINIRTFLKSASLSAKKLPSDIQNISGGLQYSNASLSWNDLKGTFKNRKYTLNGDIDNILKPVVSTKITSDNLDISTRLKIRNNTLKILSLKGMYYGTSFDVKGDVKLDDTRGPELDIVGNIGLNLRDLKLIIPLLKKKIEKIKPQGILSANVLFQGYLKDFKNADLAVKVHSVQLSLFEFQLNNLSIALEQNKANKNNLKLSVLLHDGDIAIDCLYAIKDETIPVDITALINKIDLAKAKRDTKWKKKELAGLLSASLTLKGDLKSPKNLRGRGSLLISEGHLWKLNFLDGLWGALFIPEFENIIFTDAYANFDIQNQIITTEDLILKSIPLDLLGKGWIDFDKNINFDVTPEFRETEILQSDSFKKGFTVFLAKTEGYFDIKVSGTLDHPHYTVNTLPQKLIEKTTDILLEGIQGIFEDIFE